MGVVSASASVIGAPAVVDEEEGKGVVAVVCSEGKTPVASGFGPDWRNGSVRGAAGGWSGNEKPVGIDSEVGFVVVSVG